ncbi:putative Fe-S cluster assembly protein SufB [Candidatus Hydrogenisulfobacillus filiaventi]|uniref:Putative Fe-S cluster assembly protein SufB n=1 Tax=Candidatus Hydrogenisulfobacillus filiaventi TaxID=2707344 RepID=A0A6F8ZCA6_9FIRM|nr:putative Fe-S cluster assembly protein SufB [Candidatus Hydrogenisulfobacillus filiaventi]
MATIPLGAIDLDRLAAWTRERGEPDWLAAQRRAGWSRYQAWRDQAPAGARAAWDALPVALPADHTEADDDAEVVFDNRRRAFAASGILFDDLYAALARPGAEERIRPYLATLVPPEEGPGPAPALNAALWTGGIVAHVPAGVTAPAPLSFYRTARNPGQFDRVLVVLEEGARAELVEGRPSLTYTPLHAPVMEVVLGPGARFTYTLVNNWAPSVQVHRLVRIRAGEGAAVEVRLAEFGGGELDSRLETFLTGSRAEARYYLLGMGNAGQRLRLAPAVYHQAPQGASEVHARLIAVPGAEGSFAARVCCLPGSEGSEARVQVEEAAAARAAWTVSCERLVAAPDTRAGTGVHRIPLTDETLFYLVSRGLDRHAAAALWLDGFTEPVRRRLPMEFAIEVGRLVAAKWERAQPAPVAP